MTYKILVADDLSPQGLAHRVDIDIPENVFAILADIELIRKVQTVKL